MEWDITLHDNPRYAEITTRGVADHEGSLQMAKNIAETMRKNSLTRVLIDHRNIEDFRGALVDVYERPKLFRIIGVILRIKIAEIVNPVHEKHFRFLETVCINRGYRFALFYDRTSALAWLLEK